MRLCCVVIRTKAIMKVNTALEPVIAQFLYQGKNEEWATAMKSANKCLR